MWGSCLTYCSEGTFVHLRHLHQVVGPFVKSYQIIAIKWRVFYLETVVRRIWHEMKMTNLSQWYNFVWFCRTLYLCIFLAAKDIFSLPSLGHITLWMCWLFNRYLFHDFGLLILAFFVLAVPVQCVKKWVFFPQGLIKVAENNNTFAWHLFIFVKINHQTPFNFLSVVYRWCRRRDQFLNQHRASWRILTAHINCWPLWAKSLKVLGKLFMIPLNRLGQSLSWRPNFQKHSPKLFLDRLSGF